MTLRGDTIQVTSNSAMPMSADSVLDAAREAAWRMAEVPYNPDAALVKEARRKGLGAPVTTEFDFVFDERLYRGQGFASAIVFAEVGHWGELWTVLW